jgi:NADH:ubiquinone oxidoreductase subunit
MLSRFGLLLYTKIFGRYIGQDRFNNRYYTTKTNPKKRWVLYNGVYDPSKISVEWYGWLHFLNDTPLSSTLHTWVPNTTGTQFAKKYITSIENIPQSALNCYGSWSPNRQK